MVKCPHRHVFGLKTAVLFRSLVSLTWKKEAIIPRIQLSTLIKNMYLWDHFLSGQIIEVINPPENIVSYVCKENKVKSYRSYYHISTGHFLGLYETIGYLIIRGNDDEQFLKHGFCEKNSKILYSYHNFRIPNSFAWMLFNRHCLLIETGQLEKDFWNLNYFLSSITDRR